MSKKLFLNEASELATMLAIFEGYEGDGYDMTKASGVWVVALDASTPNQWRLTINGEPVEVSHAITRMKLRDRGLLK